MIKLVAFLVLICKTCIKEKNQEYQEKIVMTYISLAIALKIKIKKIYLIIPNIKKAHLIHKNIYQYASMNYFHSENIQNEPHENIYLFLTQYYKQAGYQPPEKELFFTFANEQPPSKNIYEYIDAFEYYKKQNRYMHLNEE